MGTRADFYSGKGKEAEWLGSIAWDGYRDGIPAKILEAKADADFRASVSEFIASRDDGTTPDMGWPWPWDTSDTTDCHYWFFDGKCSSGHFGSTDEDNWPEDVALEFPDMSSRKNVTLGRRSGVIVIGG